MVVFLLHSLKVSITIVLTMMLRYDISLNVMLHGIMVPISFLMFLIDTIFYSYFVSIFQLGSWDNVLQSTR